MGKQPCRFSTESPTFAKYLVDAADGNVQVRGQGRLSQTHRLKKLFGKDNARMDRDGRDINIIDQSDGYGGASSLSWLRALRAARCSASFLLRPQAG